MLSRGLALSVSPTSTWGSYLSSNLRRLPALFGSIVLIGLAVSCGDSRSVTMLSPGAGPQHSSGVPFRCTSPTTCTGLPTAEAPELELVKVCKYYPAGTAVTPAVQVKLDVTTTNTALSPTSLVFTIDANSCKKIWSNGFSGGTPDNVTLQEIVPPGYTTTSQITTIVSTDGTHTTTSTSTAAATSASTVTGIVGGTNIPGLTVVFTNTPIPLGAIGDFVWNDFDGDGVQDAGEPGIPGVTVTLNTGAIAVTDAGGYYAFTDLVPGTYTVSVSTPSGFVPAPSNAGGDPTKDSNGSGTSTAINGNTDNSIDFGFYRLGSIGDFVWKDLNANGIQDSGEPGIAAVTLTLNTGATTTTDANGAYLFSNLPPGTYTVTPTPPAGFAPSPVGQGATGMGSRGAAGTASITGGQDVTVDFGYYQLGSIGDFVWNDLNANGIQNSGEPGIPGVTVTLSNGATTTTDANGAYAFDNLAPGTYTVSASTPSGYLVSPSNAGGNPALDSNGSGASVTISGNSNTTIDFGFYRLGSIGDFVWSDVNGNGLQDVGEVGVAGVVVSLSNGATTTTNASGAYAFTNLPAGTYTVSFTLPLGYAASPSNVGSDDTIDSDGSGVSVVVAGNVNTTIDFGIYQPFGSSSCGYTQGYWKNHEEKWPAPYSPTARWMQPSNLTPVTWDGLMGMAVKGGNSYMQLAHQWIAATLNRTSGAPMRSDVVTVLDAAKAWLIANTPVNGAVPTIKDAQATAWASVLDDYNNGKLGTLHCN